MNYDIAIKLARNLADELQTCCERIEIAGGLRRRKSPVHDIELVAIPKVAPLYDLLGHGYAEHDLLKDKLDQLVAAGRLTPGPRGGPRFMQYLLPEQIMVDLFVVRPPAQWGVIFTLRTGPAHYSHWLVTHQARGGALPNHLRIKDGAVLPLYGGTPIETPTEEDFFELLGLPMPAPEDRHPAWTVRH